MSRKEFLLVMRYLTRIDKKSGQQNWLLFGMTEAIRRKNWKGDTVCPIDALGGRWQARNGDLALPVKLRNQIIDAADNIGGLTKADRQLRREMLRAAGL